MSAPHHQPGQPSFDSAPTGSVRVLQFTDTHLYADPEQRLLGVQTQRSFENCVELARRQHWPPDLVLLSGDLVHDASVPGYERLRATVAEFEAPACVLPGNHDDPVRLAALVSGESVVGGGLFRCKSWQVIALDSTLPGSDAGYLTDSELARLDRQLSLAPERFTLISLHHPPVAIGSAWMDRIGLRNSDALFALIRRHANVRALLCGHVHQEVDAEHESVRVLASPSTCIQFAPHSEKFGVDLQPPGYRWLLLHDDGRVESGVQRLAQLPPGLETKSGGY